MISMEVDSDTIVNETREKDEIFKNISNLRLPEEGEGVCGRARALFAALLGVSVSAIALTASAPASDDTEDDFEIEDRLNVVGAARRVTKPLIRLALGSNKLSALVTAVSSVLLLFAVMSKTWRWRGARWLAVPALLTATLELCADAADTALTAALLVGTEPMMAILHTMAAGVLLTAEVLIWHCIARFFEQDAACEACAKPLAIAPCT